MPVRPLNSAIDLHKLDTEVEALLNHHAPRDLATAQRIREFHPSFSTSNDSEIFRLRLSLHDAQLTIAREHGFDTWAKLQSHVMDGARVSRLSLPHHERIEDPTFRRAVDLIDWGDLAGLQKLLLQNPKLVSQHVLFEGRNYFRNPTLLEFVAENPVRHGRLPANIVDIARCILDAGADVSARNETLDLVATGRIAREYHVQVPLINLLCDYHADPNQAIRGATLQGEQEAVEALIRRGARVDLPVAAALGRVTEFEELLATARGEHRHLALALASQFGHTKLVRLLLDAGEDPNRYNPPGGHSHSTPLHQAALGGHDSVVRLLVQHGARLDIEDVLWQGTPAIWAKHGGHVEIERYLHTQERSAT